MSLNPSCGKNYFPMINFINSFKMTSGDLGGRFWPHPAPQSQGQETLLYFIRKLLSGLIPLQDNTNRRKQLYNDLGWPRRSVVTSEVSCDLIPLLKFGVNKHFFYFIRLSALFPLQNSINRRKPPENDLGRPWRSVLTSSRSSKSFLFHKQVDICPPSPSKQPK